VLQLILFWQHFKNQLNQRYWKISSWYKLLLPPCRSLKVSSYWSFGMTKMLVRTRVQSSKSFKKLVLAKVEQMWEDQQLWEEQHNNRPLTQMILGLLSWARILLLHQLIKLNLRVLPGVKLFLKEIVMKERLQKISIDHSGKARIKQALVVQLVLLSHHRMINKN